MRRQARRLTRHRRRSPASCVSPGTDARQPASSVARIAAVEPGSRPRSADRSRDALDEADDRRPVRRARHRLRRRSAQAADALRAGARRRHGRPMSSTATSTTPTSAPTAAASAPSPRAGTTVGHARQALRPRHAPRSSAHARRPGSAAPPRSACRAASIPAIPATTYLDIVARGEGGGARHPRPRLLAARRSAWRADAGPVARTTFWRELKRAGLGSLPGTAAEILDDEVRAHHLPRQGQRPREWLEVMRDRACGRPAHHRHHHVRPRRRLPRTGRATCCACARCRSETGGFTEFVPLPFVHMEAPIYLQGPARARADLPRGGADARGGAARAASARSPTSRPRG